MQLLTRLLLTALWIISSTDCLLICRTLAIPLDVSPANQWPKIELFTPGCFKLVYGGLSCW